MLASNDFCFLFILLNVLLWSVIFLLQDTPNDHVVIDNASAASNDDDSAAADSPTCKKDCCLSK
jgi:hypothetical protein